MRAGLFETRVSNICGRLGQVRAVFESACREEHYLAICRPFVWNQTKKDSGSAR